MAVGDRNGCGWGPDVLDSAAANKYRFCVCLSVAVFWFSVHNVPESKLCTDLTRQNTTENDTVHSHVQYTTAPHQ